MSSILDAALDYESRGLSVIPVHAVLSSGRCSCGSGRCKSPGKHPRGQWRGNQSRRLSPEELTAALSGGGNVGIVTGPISGIAVLDIDGEEGLKSLEAAGFPFASFPITPAVRTGGGGIHLYFRYPESGEVRTASGVLDHVDIRALGGFVVAPPSSHSSGGRYEWVEGRSLADVPLAEFDLAQIAGKRPGKAKRASKSWYEGLLAGAAEGERNSSATRLAGRYLARGLNPEETLLLLSAWNARNTPPLSSEELGIIVGSVRRAEDKARSGLEWVSDHLGMPVLAIRRITGDEPKLIIEFSEGSCMMTTAQLLSAAAFQTAIADATKMVVPKRSAKTHPTHEQLAQAILRSSVDEDAGMEATWRGEVRSLVRDHIASQRTIADAEGADAVPISGPFRLDGLLWVSILDLVQRSSTRWGVRVASTTQMAQRMKSLGLEPRAFVAVDGTPRHMWGVREEDLK
jgi:hypothetical protein